MAATRPQQVIALTQRHGQFGNTPTGSWWWLAVDVPHASTTPGLLHTTGVALAVIGAFLLLHKAGGRVLAPLAAAGSMTLTLYVVHVIALATKLLPRDPETSWVIQVIAALLIATLWRRRFARGPLEAAIAAISGTVRRGRIQAP